MMVGKIIGRYKVERELSEGGMAHVFVGTTIEESGGFPQGFPVVLKVMSEELARESTARKRFIKEAQILSRLRHHRITRFYEFLPSETGPILVMEFVEGEPVDRLIARVKPVPIEQAIVKTLEDGYRTKDIHSTGCRLVGTAEMGDAILKNLKM